MRITYELYEQTTEGQIAKQEAFEKAFEKAKTKKQKEQVEANFEDLKHPYKAHEADSGYDMFAPKPFDVGPGERYTVNLEVRFKPELPGIIRFLNKFGAGIGVEMHIRPKSGKSKNGVDVSLGTIDEPYRGFVGATVRNNTAKKIKFEKNEKVCQLVPVYVINRSEMINDFVDDSETTRGGGGFGSTGLK